MSETRRGLVLRFVGLAVLLFAVWWMALSIFAVPRVIQDAAFVLPTIAAMAVSARSRAQRAWGIAFLVMLFCLADVLVGFMGPIGDIRRGFPSADKVGILQATTLHVVRFGIPLAALLVFAEGDVASLFTVPNSARDSRR